MANIINHWTASDTIADAKNEGQDRLLSGAVAG
jgi:hypothetical protein